MSAKEAQTEEKTIKQAVMFLLEDVAFDAHETMFTAVKKLLKEREIELTPQLFSAHFVTGRIDRNVTHLLRLVGRERLSEEKLMSEINEVISKAILAQTPQSAIKSLVKKLRDKDVAVGVVSILDDETAAALVTKAGLDDLLAGVVACGNGGPQLPASDAWWRLARALDAKPICSMTISSTSTSMRSALRTGARAIVLETPYSACQDFGGSETVVSTVKELPAAIDDWLDSVR